MSQLTDREYEAYRNQMNQLQREWEDKEDELKLAMKNEKEFVDMLNGELRNLQSEEERYYNDEQLMRLLADKREELGNAREEEEKIVEALQTERRNLDRKMEDAIDEIKRMLN